MNSSMAISITKLEKNNKISMEIEELRKILEDIGDAPLAIVSVNGPKRTGKSYILGHFMRFLSTKEEEGNWINKKLSQEFHWVNSADGQTMGIKMWSKPFYVMKDGREVAVLLLDTQGCFDDNTTSTQDTTYFMISCLLSSVLIYNIPKQISEDMLQCLQLFIGYAKLSLEGGDEKPFSKLVFLIRDWQFPRDYEYGYHDDENCPSERNFKKEKLDANEKMPDQVKVVHEEIVESFKSVGCCLMPYPGNGLAVRDKTDALEQEFVDVIKDLVPRILNAENLVIKTIGGQEITGNLMNEIIVAWDDLLAKQDIPQVKTVAEAATEAQNRMNLSIAFKIYKSEMKGIKESEGFKDEDLKSLHQRAMEKAMTEMKKMKHFRGKTEKERCEKTLKELINEKFESYEEINKRILIFKKITEQNKIEMDNQRKAFKMQMDELQKARIQEKNKLEQNKINMENQRKAFDKQVLELQQASEREKTKSKWNKLDMANQKKAFDQKMQDIEYARRIEQNKLEQKQIDIENQRKTLEERMVEQTKKWEQMQLELRKNDAQVNKREAFERTLRLFEHEREQLQMQRNDEEFKHSNPLGNALVKVIENPIGWAVDSTIHGVDSTFKAIASVGSAIKGFFTN